MIYAEHAQTSSRYGMRWQFGGILNSAWTIPANMACIFSMSFPRTVSSLKVSDLSCV